MTENPFVDLECAYEYVALLREQVEETRGEIADDLRQRGNAGRRVDCLRLVDYKLKSLHDDLTGCGRLLNDLRSLRRLLLGERNAPSDESDTNVPSDCAVGAPILQA